MFLIGPEESALFFIGLLISRFLAALGMIFTIIRYASRRPHFICDQAIYRGICGKMKGCL